MPPPDKRSCTGLAPSKTCGPRRAHSHTCRAGPVGRSRYRTFGAPRKRPNPGLCPPHSGLMCPCGTRPVERPSRGWGPYPAKNTAGPPVATRPIPAHPRDPRGTPPDHRLPRGPLATTQRRPPWPDRSPMQTPARPDLHPSPTGDFWSPTSNCRHPESNF